MQEAEHQALVKLALDTERADIVARLEEAASCKDCDSHTARVLRAQADMIKQGLHIRNLEEVPDFMGDIQRFHQKFGLEYNGKPRILEPELFEFRNQFIREEHEEWAEEQAGLVVALTSDDGKPDHRRITLGLHQQLDALVDLTYVTLGAAYLQFGPKVFNQAWNRVQKANMSKVRCEREGDSKRGSTFDVIKPQGWEPPDHHDLVRDHAHIVYRHPGTAVNPASAGSDTQVVPTAQ